MKGEGGKYFRGKNKFVYFFEMVLNINNVMN